MTPSSLNVDHVAMRVGDLPAEIERWQRLGHEVTIQSPTMASVWTGNGIRIVLLAEGSEHPSHLAFLETDADRFAQAAQVEGKAPTENKDGSRSFYTQGLKGFALEWVWRP